MAVWLVEELGQGKQFPTIVYVRPNDVRYTILVAASVKAGFKVRKSLNVTDTLR